MIILRAAQTIATRMRLQLDLFIEDAAWEGLYDRIEVWRSRVSEAGPYEPLHDRVWFPARVPYGAGDVPNPADDGSRKVMLAGKTLLFLVNEEIPVTITFTGFDPLTFAQAAAQVVAQSQGLLFSFVLKELFCVQTVGAGNVTSLRVVGGDAVPALGLSTVEPGSVAFGRDARMVLLAGQRRYSFADPNGLSSYWYEARLVNSATGAVSEFSLPFQGLRPASLDDNFLVQGVVDLVDTSGAPAANQEVLVFNAFNGTQVAQRTIAGGTQKRFTDSRGRAAFHLVRGLQVTVSVAGTTLARDIVVPTDPTVASFDLLDPGVGTNDVFSVKRPHLEYATRRSL